MGAAMMAIIGYKKPIPQLGENLRKELLSFYECCLVRDPTKRWTACKLIEHPFLRVHELNQVIS